MKNKIYPKTKQGSRGKNSITLLLKKAVHDLNNQLTGVMCYASVLSRQNRDHSLKEKYLSLIQSARKAAEIGEKIHEFSQSIDSQICEVNFERRGSIEEKEVNWK